MTRHPPKSEGATTCFWFSFDSWSRRIGLYTLALTLATVCRGQTIHIAGGSDDMVGASGAYVETFWANQWTTLVGYGNDGLGFSAKKRIPLGVLTLGDSIISFSTPGIGLTVPVRGFSYQMTTGLTIFGGATGQAYTLPFLQAQNKFESFGGGAIYSRTFFKSLTLAGSSMTMKHKSTVIGSVNERRKDWGAFVSAGVLQGQRTLDYGANASLLRFFGIAGSRSTLVYENKTTTFDDLSATAHFGPVLIGTNRYQSETSWGTSLFSNIHLLESTNVRADYLLAPSERILDLGIVRTFGSRWSFSPGATETNGSWSWTVGGSFASNFATVSLSYEEMFQPFFIKAPWEKVLLVSVNLALPHNARATVRTFLLPTGRLVWAAFADAYVNGPMGETSTGGASLIPTFEKFVISGSVVTGKGELVFGAAIHVGKTLVFTNSEGQFTVRVKNRSYPVTVNVEEFTSAGNWRVVEAPTSASPGIPVRVVVERL